MPHVPGCAVSALKIHSFRECLSGSFPESETYDRDKWLYVPDFYCDYRYILGTKGKNPLICIGINPSTAAPEALDNTLKSVERIAAGNGFDSFLMFNVSAQRATSPDDMDPIPSEELHKENMEAFDYILSLSDQPTVWAAWGTIIEKRAYLSDYLSDMIAIASARGAVWVTAGARSKKSGHPHHPLYLRADSRLEPFMIESYILTQSTKFELSSKGNFLYK